MSRVVDDQLCHLFHLQHKLKLFHRVPNPGVKYQLNYLLHQHHQFQLIHCILYDIIFSFRGYHYSHQRRKPLALSHDLSAILGCRLLAIGPKWSRVSIIQLDINSRLIYGYFNLKTISFTPFVHFYEVFVSERPWNFPTIKLTDCVGVQQAHRKLQLIAR